MKKSATLLLVLLTVISLGAQAPASDVPKLDIEKYTLANGLEVILSEDHRVPLVGIDVWYHVGPAHEAAGRTGFAHLFEHMMFQGSKHIPNDAHFRLLSGAGASGVNGTTNFDRTNYFETMPSNQLELALWLESDRMGYLLEKVDQAKLSNQQDVVRNERRQSTENQPYGMVEEAMFQALFPKGHPYHGVVIGSHEDIQAAKLDDVQQFFRQYYAPNNATIAIAGDIDKAATKKLVEKYFGTLKRGPAVPPVKVDTPPITAEKRIVVEDRVELPRLYMAWLTPPFFKDGDADADIVSGVLGQGRSSRLYKKLVYEKQMAQNVSASQVLDDARVGLQHRSDRAAQPHAPGARGGHQRRARRDAREGTDRRRDRAGAQRPRNADLQRPSARRRIRRRGRSAELVQPLPRHARLPRPGRGTPAARHARERAAVRAAVPRHERPRGRARRARKTGACARSAQGGRSGRQWWTGDLDQRR